MKSARQEKILEIIARRNIENQGQLIEALKEEGFNNTQATVSRDIRELRLVKELTPDGRYKYSVGTSADSRGSSGKLRAIFRESVASFECAQNIVVIKTLPGLASAACSAIDGMNFEKIVGTLAGDDTGFIAMADNEAAKELCEALKDLV